MDLADQIDDYICSFEGLGDITMDSLAMFVFIWAVVALFIIWLCKFVYNKYVNKEQPSSNATNSTKLNGDKPKRLSEPKEILASKEVKVCIQRISIKKQQRHKILLGNNCRCEISRIKPRTSRQWRRYWTKETNKPSSIIWSRD